MDTSLWRSFCYACIALAAACFSATASADDNDSGIYLGAGWGQFNVKIENAQGVTDVIGDIKADDNSAWKVFAGYRFMKWLAIEGDYIDLGNPRGTFNAAGSDGHYSVKLSGFGAYVIGTLPITIFELSAKAGYYWHDVNLHVNFDNVGSGNGNVINTSSNRDAFTYGVGAGVTFIDHLNVKIEYERFDLEDFKDPYALWLTGEWRF
ncbi:porin family protein [Steroidobacter cummioxidans]|uniref:porin family protein n=1 Tax=Steroidobacter cummioxidans TaxID=1803913 RepID=UPI00137A68FD|nr:porin family protein [Steroidobacter cummioxidans]